MRSQKGLLPSMKKIRDWCSKLSLFGILFVVLCFPQALFGASIQTLVDNGSSAQMIGIGNVEGFSQGASAMFENPASLVGIENFSVSTFQSQDSASNRYASISFASNLQDGVLGVGIMHMSNTYTGDPGSDISRATIAKISFEQPVTDNVYAGISYSLISQGDGTHGGGNGSNIDAGVIAQWQEYTFSVTGHNLIPNKKIVYDAGANSDIATDWVASVKYALDNCTLYGQIKARENLVTLACGASATAPFYPEILMRVGYKQLEVDQQPYDTFSLGLGYAFLNTQVDLAFQKSAASTADNVAYVSADMKF